MDELADFANRWIVEKCVVDKKHGPLGPAKINEVSSFLDAQGQWFFDPHVFAGVNGFAREREVRRWRRRQDERRNARIGQNIIDGLARRDIRVSLIHLGAMAGMNIADHSNQTVSIKDKFRQ